MLTPDTFVPTRTFSGNMAHVYLFSFIYFYLFSFFFAHTGSAHQFSDNSSRKHTIHGYL